MTDYVFLETAGSEEAAGILRLYRRAGWWTDPGEDAGLVGRIVAGSHLFLTAREEDRIVGMGRAISDRASDAYIQDVTVLAEFRGRGIGSGLVRRLAERLRSEGIGWIGLIAERGSSPMYLPLGFEPMPDSVPMLLKTP